ncbi:MAG: FtsW/RodA/SpoVE family cell cycle protein, partial [Candidatus Margulisbacteria bacterium]|nr:FtsW/RodA/SpoVE family cell cycle protein [Candidatus Margulisiibacteriota bacterium]
MPKLKIDYWFLLSVILLSAIGTATIFSASPTMGLKYGDMLFYIKRHLLFLVLGVGAGFYGFYLDLAKLKKVSPHLFLFSLIFLILVFIPGIGHNISGASRWIDLGILSFQPSELIKFTLTVY